MTRILIHTSIFLPVIFFLMVAQAVAAPEKTHPWYINANVNAKLQSAKNASEKGDWPQALAAASQTGDKLHRKIFTWLWLMKDKNDLSFSDIKNFIRDNPDWPEQEIMEKRAEKAMDGVPPQAVTIWFGAQEPLTPAGKLALGEALEKQGGDKEKINRLIREAFVEGAFSSEGERNFLNQHGNKIREEDFAARINALLWKNQISDAKRLMDRVTQANENLFKARLMLKANLPGVEAAIRALPQKLQGDQGLLYDRIKWHQKKGQEREALALFKYIPSNPEFGEEWWQLKAAEVRTLFNQRKYKQAYDLASFHGVKEGQYFAEAEWMAGWIALEYLNDPRAAYKHFYTLHQGVKTPLSLSRGAYWAGRAAKANKDMEISKNWFEVASKYRTTFFGQLAARELGRKEFDFPANTKPTSQQIKSYYQDELLRAAYVLHSMGYTNQAKKFLKAAATRVKGANDKLLIARLAQQFDRPEYMIYLNKEANGDGMMPVELLYPTLPNMNHPHQGEKITEPEKALIHAIIMQESMFNPEAQSHAGASGLMQLMPRTAAIMAKRERLPNSRARLFKDTSYNVALGARYLEEMIDYYQGSYILGIAAYNAGQGNVNKWLDQNGDPRRMKKTEDIINWIESIPFSETRNYVQRVTENLQVYRQVLESKERMENRVVEDLKR